MGLTEASPPTSDDSPHFEGTGNGNLDALAEAVKQVAHTKQGLIRLNALKVKPKDG